MDYEEEYLIYLCSCGITGKTAEPPVKELSWDRLIQLSREQTVYHFVAAAIKSSPSLPVPAGIRMNLISSLYGTAIENKTRAEAVIKLLNKMRESGIQVLVLKGYSIAALYSLPECRESADTDIYIAPEDEEKALKFLESEGFTVKPRKKETHHSDCTHPTLGLFEVHVSLWEDEIDDLIFGKETDRLILGGKPVEMRTSFGNFYTTGAYESLVYITMHMMKHFISEGITLRMMSDFILMYRSVAKKISCDEYYKLLEKFGFERTIGAILNIGKRYFGFTEDELPSAQPEDEADMDTVLTDTFGSGAKGKGDKKVTYENLRIYCDEKRIKKYGKTRQKIYFLKKYLKSLAILLFPSYKEMTEQNRALKKHKILYPWYLFVRLLSIGKRRATKSLRGEKLISTPKGDGRIDMLKKLDIR